tara:strand:+ start:707 stop:1051 length:345 start_codon:yes stop_codon:yes gene_type:complete
MNDWHILGWVWLFFGVVMVVVGLKFFKKVTQVWGIGLILLIMSAYPMYDWYKWEIDTPNFLCPDCKTEQKYLVQYLGQEENSTVPYEQKAICTECKSVFSTLEGRKPLPEPIWN